jgi:hypothetical protein
MSVRAASGIKARRLVARFCAIWRNYLRGATEGVIVPVVSVTMKSSCLSAGDSTALPRAQVGNGARVAPPSLQPVQSLVVPAWQVSCRAWHGWWDARGR